MATTYEATKLSESQKKQGDRDRLFNTTFKELPQTFAHYCQHGFEEKKV